MPVQFDYALNPNQAYDWQFSLILDPNHPTDNPTVESQILYQPYSDNERSVIPQNSPLNTAKYHGQHERTQDSLHSMALGVCNQPRDTLLNQAWAQILQSIELTGIQGATWKTCITSSS